MDDADCGIGHMKLLYIANMRLPTEKAHGVQIVQNCEALAAAGAEVTLWAARRVNRLKLHGQQDPWSFYGVARDFKIARIPSLDLHWLLPAFAQRFAFWAAMAQLRAAGGVARPFHGGRSSVQPRPIDLVALRSAGGNSAPTKCTTSPSAELGVGCRVSSRGGWMRSFP